MGCASVAHRQSAAFSQGIYAEHAAMQAGRFDLAEKYNEQLTRLAPPPKHAAVVHPFTSQGKTYVVVPASFQALPTVAIDSPAFTIAVGQDKALQGQIRAENKALGTFSKQTDSIVRAKDAEAAKYEAQKPSIWSRVCYWALALSFPLLGIGLVLLCIFCPAAIPFVIAAFRLVVHVIGAFFRAIGRLVQELETKLEKKGPSG